ncbi:MAG: hypothetical protein AVDCRST_MAG64-184 [uncultured Phycisphaerae bacterium]|uniref:Uncharacterized protein n=1 Tax=uncultured Phycisphaerae bacterium TaxID=904963 RepID=A0A6J4N419_9BACT|nr:MAG: hypothetical protein AVDCRST_MAG64-184 [uncultured Phycisphaerae bacterium]
MEVSIPHRLHERPAGRYRTSAELEEGRDRAEETPFLSLTTSFGPPTLEKFVVVTDEVK